MTAEPVDLPGFAEDALLDGRVRLLQPRRGHRAGTDAVLLASLSAARAGERAIDAGSATGAVGLMMAARVPDLRVTCVERDGALVAAARLNIGLNGWEDRVRAVSADLFAGATVLAASGLKPGEADLLVTNPPYFDEAERASPDPGRRAARRMEGGDLGSWLRACMGLVRAKGRLVLIHRADRLATCLDALRPGCGSFVVTPIHPRAGDHATRIVIAARKGGSAPLALAPPLVLHGPDGTFTPAAASMHRSLEPSAA